MKLWEAVAQALREADGQPRWNPEVAQRTAALLGEYVMPAQVSGALAYLHGYKRLPVEQVEFGRWRWDPAGQPARQVSRARRARPTPQPAAPAPRWARCRHWWVLAEDGRVRCKNCGTDRRAATELRIGELDVVAVLLELHGPPDQPAMATTHGRVICG